MDIVTKVRMKVFVIRDRELVKLAFSGLGEGHGASGYMVRFSERYLRGITTGCGGSINKLTHSFAHEIVGQVSRQNIHGERLSHPLGVHLKSVNAWYHWRNLEYLRLMYL